MVCDLFEVYGIPDYTRVPGKLLATLVCGLGKNSRVGMKLSGFDYSVTEILLARIVDGVEMLLWAGYGGKKSKKPQSVLEAMTNQQKKKKDPVEVYRSAAEFDKARDRLLEKIKEN